VFLPVLHLATKAGIKQLSLDLREIFKKAGHDLKNGLNTEQFLKVLNSNMDSKMVFNQEESDQIFQAFDQDKNGSVDEDEFVNWLIKGMQANTEQHTYMATKSAVGKKLVHLIQCVSKQHTTHTSETKRKEKKKENVKTEKLLQKTLSVQHLNKDHDIFVKRIAEQQNLKIADIHFCDLVIQNKAKDRNNPRIVVVTSDHLLTFVDGGDHHKHQKSRTVHLQDITDVEHVAEKKMVKITMNTGKKLRFIGKDGLDVKLHECLSHIHSNLPC